MRDDGIPGLADQGAVPDLLLTLLGRMQAESIACCYWKSRRRIRAALNGESDLDLLVGRRDQHRLVTLLLDCGFKPFPSVAGWGHPAISSFLGFDAASGGLHHVHLHCGIAIGSSTLKQYQPPWEDVLLDHARPHPTLPIRVLSPEAEFFLLVVRCCLELGRFDPVLLGGRRRQAREKHRADRAEVLPNVDEAALLALAAELLGDDLAPMLAGMARARGEPDGRFRRGLKRRLAPWRSCNTAEAALRGAGRTLLWGAARLNSRLIQAPRPARRRAPGGGAVIAVVGVDGSGKSTLVRSLRAWLGAETSVMPLYFGTGDGRPSLLLLPLKPAARLVQALRRTKPKGSSHGRISGRAPGFLDSLMLTLWAGVLAAEKRRKLQSARRAALRGMVVIADRYPQDQIARYNDSPLLPRVALAPAWLRRYEANSYALAGRMAPDLVVKLDAPPALIRAREPDMDPVLIERRTEDLRRLAFPGARVVSIDARKPLAEVVRAAKSAVWDVL